MIHCIALILVTILFTFMYAHLTHVRYKEYIEKTDLTEEERHEEQREAAQNFRVLVARMTIWLFCSVFAFFKNVPCIILSMAFAVDALAWLCYEAYASGKSRSITLFFLSLPFAASAMFHCFNAKLAVWGIILLVVLAALVPAAYFIGHYDFKTKGSEEK